MSTKALLELDIPEGFQLACNQRRFPSAGEMILLANGAIAVVSGDSEETLRRLNCKCVILDLVAQEEPEAKPKFEWPWWLSAHYIAMDEDGEWYAYYDTPRPSQALRMWIGGSMTFRLVGLEEADEFEPPAVIDWRESLFRNPAIAE